MPSSLDQPASLQHMFIKETAGFRFKSWTQPPPGWEMAGDGHSPPTLFSLPLEADPKCERSIRRCRKFSQRQCCVTELQLGAPVLAATGELGEIAIPPISRCVGQSPGPDTGTRKDSRDVLRPRDGGTMGITISVLAVFSPECLGWEWDTHLAELRSV